MVDPFTKKPSKLKKIIKLLKIIFLNKVPMNLLFLIIIIGVAIFAFQNLKHSGATGAAVIEPETIECPECICEEKECEADCSLCPIKTKIEKENVIYYRCDDGSLVKDLEECAANFPDVDDDYSGTVSGVTLAIDDIKLERDEEDNGFVTGISYTIINKDDLPIVPKIEIKVYKDWSYKTKSSDPNKVIDTEQVVNPNSYIQRKDKVRIYFKGEEQTLRLLLIDTLPDPDREVLAVVREFDLDYGD